MQAMQDLAEYQRSEEYLTAFENSKAKGQKHRRLSQEIWSKQKEMTKARELSNKAKEKSDVAGDGTGDGKYCEMTASEKQLVEAYSRLECMNCLQ